MTSRPPDRRRTFRPRRPVRTPDEWCEFCEQPPYEPDRFGERSCIPFDIKGLPRIPHTWPDDMPDEQRDRVPCQCGAPIDGYHHWPCDIEPCPWSNVDPEHWHQLMCCGCLEDVEIP